MTPQSIVSEMENRVRTFFPDVACHEWGVGLIRLEDGARGGRNSDQLFYPASTVKVFFLAYLAHVIESDPVCLTDEVERAAADMIIDSSNDATAFIIDTMTGTTSGPALPPPELAEFLGRRSVVQDWFRERGYEQLSARQKTWGDGPYGRERQALGSDGELRNMASPMHLARLMAEIETGTTLTLVSRLWMQGLLRREHQRDLDRPLGQLKYFMGRDLPRGWVWYSKAGWAYTNRNDMALCVTTTGAKWAIGVMTDGHLDNHELLPAIGRALFELADA